MIRIIVCSPGRHCPPHPQPEYLSPGEEVYKDKSGQAPQSGGCKVGSIVACENFPDDEVTGELPGLVSHSSIFRNSYLIDVHWVNNSTFSLSFLNRNQTNIKLIVCSMSSCHLVSFLNSNPVITFSSTRQKQLCTRVHTGDMSIGEWHHSCLSSSTHPSEYLRVIISFCWSPRCILIQSWEAEYWPLRSMAGTRRRELCEFSIKRNSFFVMLILEDISLVTPSLERIICTESPLSTPPTPLLTV